MILLTRLPIVSVSLPALRAWGNRPRSAKSSESHAAKLTNLYTQIGAETTRLRRSINWTAASVLIRQMLNTRMPGMETTYVGMPLVDPQGNCRARSRREDMSVVKISYLRSRIRSVYIPPERAYGLVRARAELLMFNDGPAERARWCSRLTVL